jgi:hypothetical protein
MVITIHKLSAGSFTFLQCLSGTELLNLSGTLYMIKEPVEMLAPSQQDVGNLSSIVMVRTR